MRYVCSVCGYVYDEAKEGKAFAELPDSWVCPLCGAAKSAFSPEEKTAAPKPSVNPIRIHEDMRKLSAGELAALCSNLARGCEKQYKDQEASLFRELAEYFAAVTPAEPGADLDRLASMIQGDLEQGYPAVNAAAGAAGDRGTKRICVWGEKVTNMLNSLLAQYRQEGEAFLADTEIWVCTVCGFVYVGDKPPELCPVCRVPA